MELPQKTKIKVVLTEDNDLLAKSLEEKIELMDHELKFIFRARNGIDLLQKLEQNHDIDTILMDLQMPELDGIGATELVKQKYPEINVIILTVFDDDEKIFQSILAGANGYLLKDETHQKIMEGIHTVNEGGAPMSAAIAAKALDLLRNSKQIKPLDPVISCSISAREIEVLEYLSQGLNYQNIASQLFISPLTVRKHIQNIYQKLHVHNKLAAIRKAMNNNLI